MLPNLDELQITWEDFRVVEPSEPPAVSLSDWLRSAVTVENTSQIDCGFASTIDESEEDVTYEIILANRKLTDEEIVSAYERGSSVIRDCDIVRYVDVAANLCTPSRNPTTK